MGGKHAGQKLWSGSESFGDKDEAPKAFEVQTQSRTERVEKTALTLNQLANPTSRSRGVANATYET